ncbi:MAG: DUF5655 domain-containing protein [Mycoplasmoidaceae bacterium]|nr:DUF5655 domain-containing protein [Mycoplasmoidaceae bacterium]
MAKGVIYLMSNQSLEGIVKIGKTRIDEFESRMRGLERDGYRVQKMKREFAIIVDNYDEIEKLLHDIFEKSCIDDSELFALDKELAIQLLSSLKGEIIYPKEKQQTIFEKATTAVEEKRLYDEQYHFNRMGEKIKLVYLTLKETIKSIFPDMDMKFNKLYLSFTKNGKNVCDIETKKNCLKLFICIRNSQISDPNKLCKNMNGTGHHGNGDWMVEITDDSKLQYIPDLIRQSYDRK